MDTSTTSSIAKLSTLLMLAFAPVVLAGEPGPVYELRASEPIEVTTDDGPELAVHWLELNDSRCPTGVQCIVAGQAQLRLSVRQAGRDPEELILVLAAGRRLGKHDAHGEIGPFRLELLSVEPYPDAGTQLEERDRWATLSIERETSYE